jgi:hypothetical protein
MPVFNSVLTPHPHFYLEFDHTNRLITLTRDYIMSILGKTLILHDIFQMDKQVWRHQ